MFALAEFALASVGVDKPRTTRYRKLAPAGTSKQTENSHGRQQLRAASRATYPLDHGSYDLQFVHADADLPNLVERLRQRPRATVCLSGPPGTGKTAFCAYLAQQLGVPFLHMRASDLLDKYVGGSEKNIAQMFATALKQRAVLLLVEADGLSHDRSHAVRGYELTQVNEILCQMEAFDSIFVCATNLVDQLDAASLRRFHLKIAFLAMKPEQLEQAFAKTLAALGNPSQPLDQTTLQSVRSLRGACLGDLHAARRHCEIMADHTTAPELIAAVALELAARAGRGQSIGFLA